MEYSRRDFLKGMGLAGLVSMVPLIGRPVNSYAQEVKLPGFPDNSLIEDYIVPTNQLSTLKKLALILAGEPQAQYNESRHIPHLKKVLTLADIDGNKMIKTPDVLRIEYWIHSAGSKEANRIISKK